MGLQMFVADGVFHPERYGLGVGDMLDIVLVAGGCGGMSNTSGMALLGGNSYFGTIAQAKSGMGAPGGTAFYYNTNCYGGAGGGGGFIPGSPWQGGSGISGPGNAVAAAIQMCTTGTNGGGAEGYGGKIIGGNGGNFGGGNCYNTINSLGEGGAGYGAGGGAYQPGGGAYYAGNAGEIKYYTHVITDSDIINGIAVTIGAGHTAASYIPNTLKRGGNVVSVMKNFKDVLVASMHASYGTYKTFELVDGTIGVSAGAATGVAGAEVTNYVKFIDVDIAFEFAVAFPGFVNSFNKAIYYCNGYYVQVNNTVAGQTTLTALPANKCRAGTAIAADKITIAYSPTVNVTIGFNETDMMVVKSATVVWCYPLWTPTSNVYNVLTVSGAMPNIYGALMWYLAPYNTDNFVPIYMSTNASNTSIVGYLSAYTSSTVSILSQTIFAHALYYCGKSGYTGRCASPDGGSTYYTFQHFLTNTNNVAYINSFFIWDKSPTIPKGNNFYGWAFNVCVDNTIGWSGSFSSPYAQYGYNNTPGKSQGGGAGGCCMITF